MRKKIKFNLAKLILILIAFLIIYNPFLNQRINNVFKLCVEFFLCLILLSRKKINIKALKATFPSILFLIISLFSTYKAAGISSRLINSFITSFSYVLMTYAIYLISLYIRREELIHELKKIFLILIILMDFVVIVTLGNGILKTSESIYLFGNKFILSYYHMFLMVLIFYDNNKKDKMIKVFVYTIYSALILKLADTTTGIIGVLVVFAFIYFTNKFMKDKNWVINSKFIIVFMIVINLQFLFSNMLFENKVIYNFLIKHSHTESILSGRVYMYSLTIKAISKNIFWGYGINYTLVYDILGFGNPQNGILKLVLDYGIVGLISFLFLIYKSFKNLKNIEDVDFIIMVNAFVYGMIVCALVEISFNSLFFLAIALANIGYELNKTDK